MVSQRTGVNVELELNLPTKVRLKRERFFRLCSLAVVRNWQLARKLGAHPEPPPTCEAALRRSRRRAFVGRPPCPCLLRGYPLTSSFSSVLGIKRTSSLPGLSSMVRPLPGAAGHGNLRYSYSYSFFSFHLKVDIFKRL